ncbi:APC family permease [Halovivax cerinus]|uniref:APC family permease n=1 Tax=Halovivax cerinus TaxID=1487865 RepID=A0ABD5NNS5_9EURY|nr:APC family permease [Halovivax cerinus]
MGTEGTSGGLVRQLSWVHSASVIIGTMIGAGIFVITAEAAGIMGPAVPLGFVLAVPVIVATALVYSVYMSSPLGDHPGGAYVHISRTWNSLFAGYLFMWLKWVSFIGALAVLSTGFGEAMQFFEPLAFLGITEWAVVWVTVFFLLNLSGVDVFGNAQAVMTGLLLLILILLALPGLAFVELDNFSPLFPDELYGSGYVDPFLQGMAALMFSYIGFEALAQTAGETENPRETLPKVFAYSTVFVGALYTLVTLVVIGVLGWEGAAATDTPLTEAAATYFPLGTAGIVAIGSMLAFATSLNSTFMVPSRILYMFGEDDIVPDALTHVNDRFNTPDVGLTITWVLAVAVLVTGTFEFALAISLAALFMMYVAHSVSALAMPWVRPELYERCNLRFKPWVLAIIAGFSAIFMGLFAWQTIALDSFGPALETLLSGQIRAGLTASPALLIVVWSVVGIAIFVGYKAYRRSQGIEHDEDRILRAVYEDEEPSTVED